MCTVEVWGLGLLQRVSCNLISLLIACLLGSVWQAASCASALGQPANRPSASLNTPIGDKWALVVGVSKFKDKSIPQLRYSAKDAKDFAQFLIEKQNFAPDHVKVLLDEQATTKNILSLLGDRFLPRVVKPDDLVVVFYSSHGSPAGRDVAKENFVVTYDTEKTNLYATALDVNDLCRLLRERAKAERILVIMDACYSGGGALGAKDGSDTANFDLENLPIGSGQCLISSSSQDERSWESKRYPNGVFTHYLMEGLRNNARLQDVFSHVKAGVSEEVGKDQSTTQTPLVASKKWSGNSIVLAAVPSKPAPIPQDVQKLIDDVLDPSHSVQVTTQVTQVVTPGRVSTTSQVTTATSAVTPSQSQHSQQSNPSPQGIQSSPPNGEQHPSFNPLQNGPPDQAPNQVAMQSGDSQMSQFSGQSSAPNVVAPLTAMSTPPGSNPSSLPYGMKPPSIGSDEPPPITNSNPSALQTPLQTPVQTSVQSSVQTSVQDTSQSNGGLSNPFGSSGLANSQGYNSGYSSAGPMSPSYNNSAPQINSTPPPKLKFSHYAQGYLSVDIPDGGTFAAPQPGWKYTQYIYDSYPYFIKAAVIPMATNNTMVNGATVTAALAQLYAQGICSEKTRNFFLHGHAAEEFRLWTKDGKQQGRLIFVIGHPGIFAFRAMVPNPGNFDVVERFFNSIRVY